jgi:hypothetical protein
MALVTTLGFARQAWGQACCAGAGALTPGRLSMHEDALVGMQLRGATTLGTFDDGARYASVSSGNPSDPYRENDFEEDVFGAVRLLRDGQVALLVPFVQTYRHAGGLTEFGGGIGDVNLSARYDFYLAGQSRFIPGVALLAGVTAPTGTPPDAQDPKKPLGTNATGVGAWQGNAGAALEQIYGPWLFNVTEIVAWRAARTADIGGISENESLAPQFTTLVGTAYTFNNDASVALFGSYTLEGTATLNGGPAPDSAKRVALLSISGVYPLTDRFRLRASLFLNPPISGLGQNQTATTGLTLGLVWGWT